MVTQKIDNITFRLMEFQDLSFLSKYGEVFCVFDSTGSGCISFGVKDEKSKYFIKIAGAKTIRPYIGVKEAVDTLKNSMQIYIALEHPNLIELLDHYEHNNLYVAIFKWVEGENLFDYWNFEKYEKMQVKSPNLLFKELPIEKKLESFNVLFDFLINVEKQGYVAIDFYDGSIIYDFEHDITKICDIDFYKKSPTINDSGINFFGTKRLKAPEEYNYGDEVDNITNVFTIGALIFHFFGKYTDNEIRKMYKNNRFFPCKIENWTLDKELYEVTTKSVNEDRKKRYSSLEEFYRIWKSFL